MHHKIGHSWKFQLCILSDIDPNGKVLFPMYCWQFVITVLLTLRECQYYPIGFRIHHLRCILHTLFQYLSMPAPLFVLEHDTSLVYDYDNCTKFNLLPVKMLTILSTANVCSSRLLSNRHWFSHYSVWWLLYVHVDARLICKLVADDHSMTSNTLTVWESREKMFAYICEKMFWS